MKNREILVADDDLIAQNMLKSALSGAGYSVLIASSGQEAVKLAKDNRPALIVLDINMPQMDGGEVAEILKSDRRTESIPIIFLSALVTKSEEKISGDKSLVSFMSKPYGREQLLNEVRRLIIKADPSESA